MYETALTVHNILRLAVLVVAFWVVLRAVGGWLGSTAWTAKHRLSMLVLMILVDLQLTIGLLLHFVWSPVTKNAFSDMGAAMKDASVRKFLVEHPIMMIGGIALVHAAKIMNKNSKSDAARHRRTAIFVGIALVLFFVGSAWPWQSVPRPWLRLGG
ncbi:MAG: hypothetical protein NTY35_14710 [Planctomycetota bacterium]|nr:hypothetical protein [Planctomycetota bacterium]